MARARDVKYSTQFNNELEIETAIVLSQQKEGITLRELSALIGKPDLTSQKLACVVKKVAQLYPIIKAKGKDGLLRYKAEAVHREQGYDMSFYDNPKMIAEYGDKWGSYDKPSEEGWVAPAFRKFYEDFDI